jgi:hypothetical protein
MLLFECEKGGDSEHRQRNKIIQDRDDFAPGDSFFADEEKNEQIKTHHKLKIVAKK